VIVGPFGEALTLDKLPRPRQSIYWNMRQKAQVLAAVEGGLLTAEEACERYDMAMEELASWNNAVKRSGVPGLRLTQAQKYRKLWTQQQIDAEKVRQMTSRRPISKH